MTDAEKAAPKPPQYFAVPAGTPSGACRGCNATIYWIVTDAGNRMPVDCDVDGGLRPVRFVGRDDNLDRSGGRGISHFVNCPQAGAFRRAR